MPLTSTTITNTRESHPVAKIAENKAALREALAVLSYEEQSLTDGRKAIARANILAARGTAPITASDNVLYFDHANEDWSFPSCCLMSTGRIVYSARNGYTHADAGALYTFYSDDGGLTISTPVELRADTDDVRDTGISVVTKGGVETVMLSAIIDVGDLETTFKSYVYESTDGATFGAASEITEISGKILTTPILDTGTSWLIGAYDYPTNFRVRVYRSTDEGATWSAGVLVVDEELNESGLIMENGLIYVFMRSEFSKGFRLAVSDDDGLTFASLPTSFPASTGFSFGVRPRVVKYENRYYIFIRSGHVSYGVGGIGILVSDDLQNWQRFATIPVEHALIFAYAAWLVVDGVLRFIYAAVMTEDEGAAGERNLGWATIDWAKSVNSIPFGDAIQESNPLIRVAPRSVVEMFAQSRQLDDNSYVEPWGQWEWACGGTGATSLTTSPFKILGRALRLTTANGVAGRYAVSAVNTASGIGRASAITFWFTVDDWTDVRLRFGMASSSYGPLAAGLDSSRYQMIELDYLDYTWKYYQRGESDTTKIGTEIGEHLAGVTAPRLCSVRLIGDEFNSAFLGGIPGYDRAIVTAHASSGYATRIGDIQVPRASAVYNQRPYMEVTSAESGVPRTMDVHMVELQFAEHSAIDRGVPM